MSVELIGDPGSCHMGQEPLARELIHLGRMVGLDAVKFQLLTPAQLGTGNVMLDWEIVADLAKQFSPFRIYASVFNDAGIHFLASHGFRDIKFPYSQWTLFQEAVHAGWLRTFERVYVSTDVMRVRPQGCPGVRWLYCIPEYPVPYEVNFEGLFFEGILDGRFDGFSSHALGILQDVRAIRAGATIIEKHFTLDRLDIACPDHQFALRPHRLRKFVNAVRQTKHAAWGHLE